MYVRVLGLDTRLRVAGISHILRGVYSVVLRVLQSSSSEKEVKTPANDLLLCALVRGDCPGTFLKPRRKDNGSLMAEPFHRDFRGVQ